MIYEGSAGFQQRPAREGCPSPILLSQTSSELQSVNYVSLVPVDLYRKLGFPAQEVHGHGSCRLSGVGTMAPVACESKKIMGLDRKICVKHTRVFSAHSFMGWKEGMTVG